jgi:hypothetical protein
VSRLHLTLLGGLLVAAIPKSPIGEVLRRQLRAGEYEAIDRMMPGQALS